MESFSSTACNSNPPQLSWAQYNGTANGTNNNQMSATSQNAAQSSGYDAAGNITFDGVNSYVYDAEGRICAVKSEPIPGTYEMTAYVYDSQGNRVGKGSITTLSCNKSTNGFVASAGYVTGLHGEQMTETNGTTEWVHTNVFASGSLIATYHDTNLYFAFEDWLRTKRAEGEVLSNGSVCLSTYYSLPFGDGLTTSGGGCTDATELHFTQKERDTESGNDYFGARYYQSIMGRWMSPDESLNGAIMELPQTWNKYSYEYNRPMYGTDPDGRCPPCIGAIIGGVVEGGFDLGKQFVNNGYSFKGTNWQEVGANAAGGAVAGAIAGATGGASLILDAAAGATGNIAGGIVTRAASGDSADEVLSAGAVSEDALAGFVGGAGGHIAGDLVHIPGEPNFSMSGRNGRIYNQAYRQGLRDLNARNTQAFVNQGVRAGVTSSGIGLGIQDLWERWFFNGPQCHTEQTTTTIYNDNGNAIGSSAGQAHQVCN